MNCYVHPEREAVGVCVSCGKAVCPECNVAIGEKLYCKSCAGKTFSTTSAPGQNTSGMGSQAVVPDGVRGWNWGASLLSWIWAIGNNTWIGLLALIPYVGLVMSIILGVKGNEWAWRNKRWNSVEHFRKTQRTWAWWGLGVFLLSFILGLLVAGLVVITDTGLFL